MDGRSTSETGPTRHFVWDGLDLNQIYHANVRAQFEVNGRVIEQAKTVTVTAGSVQRVAFGVMPEPYPVTSLTIHVPHDAKVYLASHEMRQTGPVRIFETTELPATSNVRNYQILVTVNRHDRVLKQERLITIRAGQNQEESFYFDEPVMIAGQ